MKEGKYTDKIKNLMELGGKNKNKETKNKVEYNGEEDGVTRAAQSKKYKNSTPNMLLSRIQLYSSHLSILYIFPLLPIIQNMSPFCGHPLCTSE